MEGHSTRLRDGCRFVSTVCGNGYAHFRREGGEFGQSSVGVNTVEVVVFADVDAALLTPGADPAPPSSAGNHPLSNLKVGSPGSSRHHDPHHFVSKNDGARVTAAPVGAFEWNHSGRLVLAGVCPTQRTHFHLEDNFLWPR